MFFNLIFLYVSESIYPADKDSYSPEYDCLLRANSYIFIILLVFAFQKLSKSHFWTDYFRIFSHNCIGKKNGRGIMRNILFFIFQILMNFFFEERDTHKNTVKSCPLRRQRGTIMVFNFFGMLT